MKIDFGHGHMNLRIQWLSANEVQIGIVDTLHDNHEKTFVMNGHILAKALEMLGYNARLSPVGNTQGFTVMVPCPEPTACNIKRWYTSH